MCAGGNNCHGHAPLHSQVSAVRMRLFRWERPKSNIQKTLKTLGACRNSFFGVFGIFLAKNSFQSSKFSEGIFFTWPLFSHFVKGAG
jgi:hypothetical protein